MHLPFDGTGLVFRLQIIATAGVSARIPGDRAVYRARALLLVQI
jgi:hypothetical protein